MVFLLPRIAAAAAFSDPFSRLDEFLDQGSDLVRSRGDVQFYAGVGFSAAPDADRSRLHLTVSIPQGALRFLRSGEEMVANFRISVYWKDLSSNLSGERIQQRRFVQVADAGWSSRFHAFQTDVVLAPGAYRVEVEVEDRNARKYGHVTREVEVPLLSGGAPALSSLFLLPVVNAAEGIECGGDPPGALPLNTLSAYPYAAAVIPFRIEASGLPPDPAGQPALRVAVVDSVGGTLREQRLELADGPGIRPCAGRVAGAGLSIGRYRLRVELIDAAGTVRAARERPFFIASSDRWLVDHFDDLADYLRFIAGDKEIEELREAPAGERIRLWREFWERRDPLPSTPANEGLAEFFDRLRYVNRHFTTHIERGWKTDRGRVYMTLGPPDERLFRERSSAFGSWEIWIYDRSTGFRTTLYFEDRGFTGDYRLVNPGAFVHARSKLR
jgi:GWxTD domain-containing protein